jgi:hypothetical protein
MDGDDDTDEEPTIVEGFECAMDELRSPLEGVFDDNDDDVDDDKPPAKCSLLEALETLESTTSVLIET